MRKGSRRGIALALLLVLASIAAIALFVFIQTVRQEYRSTSRMVRALHAQAVADSAVTSIAGAVNQRPWEERFYLRAAMAAASAGQGPPVSSYTFTQATFPFQEDGPEFRDGETDFIGWIKDVSAENRRYRVYIEVTHRGLAIHGLYELKYSENLLGALNRPSLRSNHRMGEVRVPVSELDALMDSVQAEVRRPENIAEVPAEQAIAEATSPSSTQSAQVIASDLAGGTLLSAFDPPAKLAAPFSSPQEAATQAQATVEALQPNLQNTYVAASTAPGVVPPGGPTSAGVPGTAARVVTAPGGVPGGPDSAGTGATAPPGGAPSAPGGSPPSSGGPGDGGSPPSGPSGTAGSPPSGPAPGDSGSPPASPPASDSGPPPASDSSAPPSGSSPPPSGSSPPPSDSSPPPSDASPPPSDSSPPPSGSPPASGSPPPRRSGGGGGGLGGAGSGCFVASTPVWTPGGLVPIEQVCAGDEVVTMDPATGRIRTQRVLWTHEVIRNGLVRVTAGSQVLICSDNHRFRTAAGAWEAIGSLRGAALSASGPMALSVEALPDWRTVYNLEVEHDHDYFVGSAHLLVHNMKQIQ